MSTSTTTTESKSTQQNATGSRFASFNPKILLRKDFYMSGLRGGMLTFVAILSILALYSIVAVVSVANVVRYIRTRRSGKGASINPPGDFQINFKPAGKAVEEDGPNMDEVQEIPGEIELAMLKDVMPADELIPEIDSSDEAESVHGLFSDDDTTLVNREDFTGVKNTEAAPIPAVPHKDDVERPISPPATPPTRFATTVPMTSVPQFSIPAFEVVEAMRADAPSENKPRADEEPTRTDTVVEKATQMTVTAVEEAAKAVEEHARIVEEANMPSEPADIEPPAPAVVEAPVPVVEEPPAPAPVEAPESNVSESSPTSEFVVVPEHADESEAEIPTAKEEPAEPAVESPKASSIALAEEPKSEVPVTETPVVSEEPAEEPVAPIAPVAAPVEPESASALVAEPESLEAPVEAPVEAPKVAEEPKPIEVPAPTEAPKPVEETPAEVPRPAEPIPSMVSTPKRKDSISSMNAPKSLGRPRVMRRATGSTAAVAGVTTSPASTAPIAIVDNKDSSKERALRRADAALNSLANSILRSNTSERLPSRPASPATLPRSSSPANVPRSGSPSGIPRSGSPANAPRSESPSSETAGSRPASPALGMSRRGSIALANGARPNVSRQSSLANVTNAPAPSTPRQQSALSNSTVPQSTFGRRTPTSTNAPRGGSVSPPPMPLPPQRQGSVSRQPTVPQAAVMSPSVLSRKATLDSNGSPGSPPAPVRRPISPPPSSSSARPPAEEFTTSGSTARRRVPFPSASDGGQQPINAAPTPVPANRPRPQPRKSTSGSTNGPSAPNTLQASLLANLGGPKPPSSEASGTANAAANSSAASPIRRDSFASAVSNRDSILSFSDRSDMDMSDLDFSGGEGHRVGVKFPSGAGPSDEEGFSGNEEEKRKRRARRRSKARTLSLKKQKRAKRN